MSVYRQAELPPAGMNAGSEEVPAPGVQRVPDLLGQAGELLRTGRRVRALVAYRMVLGLDPKRVDVAQRIAWIEREEQTSGDQTSKHRVDHKRPSAGDQPVSWSNCRCDHHRYRGEEEPVDSSQRLQDKPARQRQGTAKGGALE